MGLLDDAIREHLELKRRRGADPAELERAEREALGPVRRKEAADVAGRGSEPYDEATADGSDPYDDEELAYHDADADWPEGEDRAPEGPSRGPAPDLENDPVADYRPYQEDQDLAPGRGWRGEAFAEGEAPFAPPSVPPPAPAANGDLENSETAEYRLQDELPPEEGDDVLEETPEFLQDTPDHDRLWFEQRPPRDFDFDG